MAEQVKEKKKSGFKMPHLLFLLLGMMVLMIVLTYILPAGQFVDGVYTRVERNPVNPWQALLYIYDGITNSGMIIAILLSVGGAIQVTMKTGALDRVIDACVYKLKDKGAAILVPMMFFLMAMLGGFSGSDALIAVVPIGVLVAKKLRLDPIVGASMSLAGTLTGFACSPGGSYMAQGLMEIPLYSGYTERVVILMITAAVGAVYATLYAVRVEKNPSRSLMGNLDWQADLDNAGELKEVKLDPKDLLTTVLFIGQFPVAIFLNIKMGFGNAALPAVMIPMSIVLGYIQGKKSHEIGNDFASGVGGMGFIAFIIGFAGAISLVMRNGMILDTIAYYASLPLQNLSKGFAAIGISIVVTILNFFIPSASAKTAALMPIVKPMAETLGLTGQVAVQAFKVGDGMCNVISPFLGWTMGGIAVAKVPYDKWLKWAVPFVLVLLVLQWIILYYLTAIGWTGV